MNSHLFFREFALDIDVTEKQQRNVRHHELSCPKHTRGFTNVAKMKETIVEHGDPFGHYPDEAAKIMTKSDAIANQT